MAKDGGSGRDTDLQSVLKKNGTFSLLNYLITMNIQHRITGDVFFVTDTVVDWVDVFTRPIYKHIILESLEYCQQNKGLVIYAWVLMSNHLHAIVGSSGDNIVSDIS